MSLLQRSLPVLSLAVIAGASCSRGDPTAGSAVELNTVDTIVAPGSLTMTGPSEITLDAAGRLFVTDFQAQAIFVLDSAGTLLGTVGRAGAGPGELGPPRATRVQADTVRVLDDRNGRISTFLSDGRFIRVVPMPAGANAGALSFCPAGGAVLALNGRYGALAQRFGPMAEPGPRLGVAVVQVPNSWNFTAIKQEIFDGRVPDVLRNMTHPVCGSDGTLWLLLVAEARLLLFSPTDSLRWDRRLAEPEFPILEQEFFESNRRDSAPFRFIPLTYFADEQEVQRRLWLLVEESANRGAQFLVLDFDGLVRHRLRIPAAHGIRRFAIDATRGWLYLLAQDAPAILRARLPETVFAQPNPHL